MNRPQILSFVLASAFIVVASPDSSAQVASTPATESIAPSPCRRHTFEDQLVFSHYRPNAPKPWQFAQVEGCGSTPLVPGWVPLPFPKFDPYRNVVFLSKELTSGYQLWTLDACGLQTVFAPVGGMPGYSHNGVAPAGDGRVYLLAASSGLTCVDALDVAHPVTNANGQPYVFPYVVSDLVYDHPSGALIVLRSANGPSNPCMPPGHANAVVTKLPLDSTGLVVSAPRVEYTLCAGSNDTSVPRIARHEDGRLLLFVVTTGIGYDVVSLDAQAMSTSPFCTPVLPPTTAFTGTFGRLEFAYSSELNGVVSVTQNIPCGSGCTPTMTLRLYPEGYVGIGIPVCTWQNEIRAQLVELQSP